MKHAIVCGAGGFIGHHLVKRLKQEGYSVRGVDRKQPEFEPSQADEFLTVDLRYINPTDWILKDGEEIYQLAAEMGGMGFIGDPANDAVIMRSSTQINLNVLEAARLQTVKPRLFFSSSACVYEDTTRSFERPECTEEDAYPANPDSEYGWEKLYAERLYAAYSRCYGIETRIARIHNCYGPLGTWRGGREKAPAALCRKIAQAHDHIEIWGDGTQQRSFMYIDDCIEGIRRLMASEVTESLNLGSDEMVTVRALASLIMEVARKYLRIRYVEGPLGVDGRNSDNTLIKELLDWEPTTALHMGLKPTYDWIAMQVEHLGAQPKELADSPDPV